MSVKQTGLERAVEFAELVVSMDTYRTLCKSVREHLVTGAALPKRLTVEDMKPKPMRLEEARANILNEFQKIRAALPVSAVKAFLSHVDVDVLASDISDVYA